MKSFLEILSISVGAKTVGDYLYAFALFLILLVLFSFFKRVVIHSLKKLSLKTKTNFDNRIMEVVKSISFAFYFFLAIYFPLRHLAVSPVVDKTLSGVFLVVVVIQTIVFLEKFLALCFDVFNKEEDGKMAFNGINLIVKIILWTVGFLLVLSNLGFDITSLVASLGIGGIAIALAVQNILGDIFSSFSIYFDKPFKVGDFIVVGADSGTVKKIGLKTTRLESLQGEELVISNKELTSVRVQNFKKMKKRRVEFMFNVDEKTSVKNLKNINLLVEKVFKGLEDVEFGRVHFLKVSEFGFTFVVVYFVLSGEYGVYMDKNQELLFGIKEALDENKIQFAFHTGLLK